MSLEDVSVCITGSGAARQFAHAPARSVEFRQLSYVVDRTSGRERRHCAFDERRYFASWNCEKENVAGRVIGANGGVRTAAEGA